MRILISTAAAALGLALAATIVVAQDGSTSKARTRVMAENARVRAYELTFPPGAVNPSMPASSTRVVRVIAGGTLERTYGDGKTERITYRTGEVRINESSLAFSTKNVGSSQIRLYVVQLK
jgi:hypothetical protein